MKKDLFSAFSCLPAHHRGAISIQASDKSFAFCRKRSAMFAFPPCLDLDIEIKPVKLKANK